MRGKKKIAVRIAAAFACACCLLNIVTPISQAKQHPYITTVHAEGAITVKRKILEYITALLASGKIAISNIAQDPDKYWNALEGLVQSYSTAKNISQTDWDAVAEKVQIGHEAIRAEGAKAANTLNGFMKWLRESYDLSSVFDDDSVKARNLYYNGSGATCIQSYNENIYVANKISNNRKINITVSHVPIRMVAIGVKDNDFVYIYGVSLVNGKAEIVYSSGSIYNVNDYIFHIPYFKAKTDYSGKEAVEYCYGNQAVVNIDAVVPDSLPENLADIDDNNAYEISLKNMRDIDIWKDADLSSEKGIEKAINDGITHPVSIDAGNDISIPVAYPLNIPADDPALKVPITVGKEIPIDTPIPTALPTAVPVPTSMPVPTTTPYPTAVPGTTATPVDPTIPDNPAVYKLPDITGVFPFSVPFDLYKAFTVLNADPVTPKWTIHIMGHDFDFDMSFLDPYMPVIRGLICVLFVIGLIFITRYFVGGQ